MAAPTIEQAFQHAVSLHQAGRLADAEEIYRQILAAEPRHDGAMHLLGVIAHQFGKNDVAAELILRAIVLRPDFPDAHCNLGNALLATGRLHEAIAAFRKAIAQRPDFPDALINLGSALCNTGQFTEAAAAFRHTTALRPDYAEAHSNLGNALKETGQLTEAAAACRRAIALKPDLPEAHSNLGNILHDLGQHTEAAAACQRAIALRPGYPEAHYNLGNAHLAAGRVLAAIAAYRQALTLRPNYPDARNNLGTALREAGLLDEAVAAFRLVIALKPDLPEAHSNLGSALREQGRLDEALAAYRSALAIRPGLSEAHSNLAYLLHFLPGVDAPAIFDEHRAWAEKHADTLTAHSALHTNDRTPARRLRIGYLSPDLHAHSVAFFIEPLLAAHDPAQFEIFCYASVARPDAYTARLRALVPHWRDVAYETDEKVAARIRDDRIDILVDLAGHTAFNRLLVLARRPAPVQVSWLGYPDTTGMAAIGWRITDAHADPPGTTEHLHTERLHRLPGSAWCYRPPADTPPVKSAPFERNGHITYGCFNSLPKINAPLLACWARILHADPSARILLKNRSLHDPATREHLHAALTCLSIPAERITLLGYEPEHTAHFAAYDRVDIALDTFPYHGTTTTCEALWMGVPVITLAGKTHVTRVGASLLTNVGLPELIAHSADDYAQKALALAHDHPRLAALRHTLREQMRRSPLMDEARHAREIETAYRAMWTAWCVPGGDP